MHTIKAVLNGL